MTNPNRREDGRESIDTPRNEQIIALRPNVEHGREQTRSRIDALRLPEPDREIIPMARPAVEHAPRNVEVDDRYDHMKDLLNDISDDANALTHLNMGHRTADFWSYIPVAANIRSHTMATKEADSATRIQANARKIERLAVDMGIPLSDIQPLIDAAASVSAPGGVSKWVSSILLFPRRWHRNIWASGAENIVQAAQNLRHKVREYQRHARNAA
jgi:hypothetical protein